MSICAKGNSSLKPFVFGQFAIYFDLVICEKQKQNIMLGIAREQKQDLCDIHPRYIN